MAQRAELKKIAEGREAEMFAWEEGKILRLLRDSGEAARRRLESDTRVLQGAAEHGLRVPAVYGTTEVMGRPGLIMERIRGADLLTVIARRPWRVWWVGGITGRVHAAMHGVVAPHEVPSTKENLIHALTHSPRVPKALADATLRVLAELPEGDRLSHGDFHPANILMDGRAPVVIDWSNVTRGDPAADVARTLVILGSGEPPPGSPAPLRLMALIGRRLLVSAYLRAYRRLAPLDMDLVRRWEAVRLADRLADGIAEERPALLRKLSKTYGVSL